MFCPKCKAEYVRGITVCADCDVPLVDKLPEQGESAIETSKIDRKLKFQEFIITFNMGEIVYVKSLLGDAGIDYYIEDEHFDIVRSSARPVRLMIRKDQVKEALELLKDLDFGSVGWPSEDEKS